MRDSHAECFACGSRNPRGLQLEFSSVGKSRIVAECTLGEEFQGYPGVVQGGIVATLLDSAMTNCLLIDDIEAVTASLIIRFREPVLVNRRTRIDACLLRRHGRYFVLKASAVQDNRQRAIAEGKFLMKAE